MNFAGHSQTNKMKACPVVDPKISRLVKLRRNKHGHPVTIENYEVQVLQNWGVGFEILNLEKSIDRHSRLENSSIAKIDVGN